MGKQPATILCVAVFFAQIVVQHEYILPFLLDGFLARSGTIEFGEHRVHCSASDTVKTVFGSIRSDTFVGNLTSSVPSNFVAQENSSCRFHGNIF
jgi:hypothetical protein